jgi:hypothetical protein
MMIDETVIECDANDDPDDIAATIISALRNDPQRNTTGRRIE